jgi:catechol 2,3-dioxygenase-like lactoylglutathione lyase family enzyme
MSLAKLTALVFLALALLANVSVSAKPVPDSERIPVDLRRTTLLVRDIDKSLPLYRDALGFKVIYDEFIGGGTDADGKATPPTIRLVLLRSNDDFIGVLGLMQRLNLDAPTPAPVFERAKVGGVILVINAADLETRFATIKSTPNVKVATEPTRIDYPAPGGGKIPVLFSAVWDADGYFVEINKILGAPAGQ